MTASLKRRKQSWAPAAAVDFSQESPGHNLLRAAADVYGSDRCFLVVTQGLSPLGPSIEIRRDGRPTLPANSHSDEIPTAVVRRATVTRTPVYYHFSSTGQRGYVHASRRGPCLCVPVVIGKTVSALLCLERSTSGVTVTKQQLQIIESLAQQAAIAIACADRCDRALRAFQARVNAPFLHNTFSVIAEMVIADPPKAEAAIVMLSRVCRYVLDAPVDHIVTLDQELAITKDYLALEQLRLGDRMEVQVVEKGPLERVHVPALILQSLAEIATRVGIARRVGRGCLHVEVSVNPHRCRLRIRDRSLKGASEAINGDINFREVKRRLGTFYPGAHSFRVSSRQGVSLDITFPRDALGSNSVVRTSPSTLFRQPEKRTYTTD